MKTHILIALIVVLHLTRTNAQLLRYQFNEGVGTTASSTGSVQDSLTLRNASGAPAATLWGAAGSGPSASVEDRAIDLTSAAGMGSGFTGPNAFSLALSSLPALTQFTITGWFRPSSTDLGRAVLAQLQNGSDNLSIVGLSGGPVGARNRLRLMINTGDPFPEIDAVGDFEPQWSTPDVWAFFAISYNGQSATDKVRFYSGDLSASVSLSASDTGSAVLFPFDGATISIGASGSNTDPFRGYLDDFRLYGNALTALAIEQVRLEAVPEPSSGALFFGALWFLRRRSEAKQPKD